MGSQRVGHYFVHTHTHVWEEIGYEVGRGRGKENVLQLVNILETTKLYT